MTRLDPPHPGTTRSSNAQPRVTAAAGCGGWGPELARFGQLSDLDGLLVGPVGHRPFQANEDHGAVTAVPGGVVYQRARVREPHDVVAEVFPWLAARGLRAVVAVRGESAGEVADVVRTLRRSVDFSVVCAVEVDLTAAVDGLDAADADQAALRIAGRAAEELPRSCGVHAKVPVLHPGLVAVARSAVAGGSTALVAAGAIPLEPPQMAQAGPGVEPATIAGVRTLRGAMVEGRLPTVPVIVSGGISGSEAAARAAAAGAWGVQLGSALFADPHLLWQITQERRSHVTAMLDPAPMTTGE